MLDRFQRFAVYYAPKADGALAQAGARWLGWDPEAGEAVEHPDLGLDLAQLTQSPRRYGLHGTLTPPMRLGCGPATFFDAVDTLAQGLAPVDMGALCLRPVEGWLAIVPQTQTPDLTSCAAEIVEALDPFRAPLSERDLARRRAAGLSARQEALLQQWGYPYVMEDFRFHITLTNKLENVQMPDALRAAQAWFGPALEHDCRLDALCVFGEDEAGYFHLLTRFAMRG